MQRMGIMKKNLAFTLFLLLLSMSGIRADEDTALVRVTGIAEKEVKPDTANVIVFLKADSTTLAEAEKSYAAKYARLEKALKEKCPNIRAIEQTSLGSGEKINRTGNGNYVTPPQPEVRKQITVELAPDPVMAIALVDIAIRNNARLSPDNHCSYESPAANSCIIYAVKDYSEIEKELKAKAVEDLQKNAAEAADAIGQKAGKPMEFKFNPPDNLAMGYWRSQNASFKYYGVDPDKIKMTVTCDGAFELYK